MVSLILWTLTLIVTVKYILFLMSADNDGEGGSVALMALAQRALGRPSAAVFILGVVGVALFAGDGVITPAFSVLSAVEGLKAAPHIGPHLAPSVCRPRAAFWSASSSSRRGAPPALGAVRAGDDPWFLGLAALGRATLGRRLVFWLAVNPLYAVRFLVANGLVGFLVLGSVFLAVTGAEALYADMGHFGKGPIRLVDARTRLIETSTALATARPLARLAAGQRRADPPHLAGQDHPPPRAHTPQRPRPDRARHDPPHPRAHTHNHRAPRRAR